jgi:hypothetical protein
MPSGQGRQARLPLLASAPVIKQVNHWASFQSVAVPVPTKHTEGMVFEI